jgi:hypothetical protein
MIRSKPSRSGHYNYHLIRGRPSVAHGIYGIDLKAEHQDDG